MMDLLQALRCDQMYTSIIQVNSAANPTQIVALDHVQVAIPVGSEDVARAFYSGVLGLCEVPKPPVMAARGGAWFEAGTLKLHVGADHSFNPARKAHPALLVGGDLAAFVAERSLPATWSHDNPDVIACHIDDPFGNRIELVQA
jgi:catechol 2,3-dioxygenase-like lactoylglutathione lyase family enzyme